MPLINDRTQCRGFGANNGRRAKNTKAREELAFRELYTLDEVALILNISRSSITNLITIKRRGERPRLRTVREGRMVRVTRDDLNTYISRLRTEAGIPGVRR